METLEPFNIIYQTAEDGLGDTVKPRLIEADADLERVLVKMCIRDRFQFVIFHQVPQLLDVEGSKPGAAGNENGF